MEEDFKLRQDLSKFDGLDDIDRRLIVEKLNRPNITGIELAQMTGMSAPGISYRMAKSSFQTAYLTLMGTTDELLLQAAIRAANKINRLIESKNEKIALEATKFALQNKIAQKIELQTDVRYVYSTNVEPDGSLVQKLTTELLEGKKEDG